MEEEKVTEPVVETKTEENTFTQEDVNNIVAKETKKAVEKLLKDLGVEDVKSAKEGLSKFKEIQDAQKSDYDKALERIETLEKENKTLEKENNEYKAEKKSREEIDSIKSILKEKNIDEKYAKTVKKLMTDEISEESVMATIEEELPMLLNVETVKIGTEKKENKPSSSINDYLDKKYKDNPFYKR